MRIIRYSHSCVRIEIDGAVIVIDPGIWSEPLALVGADAVLVTHEHTDHVDELRLAGLSCAVFAPAGAALSRIDFQGVAAGESFEAAGVPVQAIGGQHATVLPGQSLGPNLGYLVGGVGGVYHPGDALDLPSSTVDTLLVPMQASWLKTSEAVDFLRAADYRQAFGIHDGQINERAVAGISRWYDLGSGGRYEFVPPGGSRDVLVRR